MTDHRCPSRLRLCEDHPRWNVFRYGRLWEVWAPQSEFSGMFLSHPEAITDATNQARKDAK